LMKCTNISLKTKLFQIEIKQFFHCYQNDWWTKCVIQIDNKFCNSINVNWISKI
jgi:hypothetical protein